MRTSRNALRRWRGAVVVTVIAVGMSVTSCGSDDDSGSEQTTATETSTPDTSEAPQIGSGTGLADTAYVPLDNETLSDVPGGTDIDDTDPESVLVGGLEASFAWVPATDYSQFDSFTRASSVWNNTYLADQEQRLTTLVPMSGRDWESWADRDLRFFPRVKITSETHPPDTDTDFSRVVTIDMSTGRDDDPEAGRDVLTLIGQARVHKSEHGWRIDNLKIRDTIVGDS